MGWFCYFSCHFLLPSGMLSFSLLFPLVPSTFTVFFSGLEFFSIICRTDQPQGTPVPPQDNIISSTHSQSHGSWNTFWDARAEERTRTSNFEFYVLKSSLHLQTRLNTRWTLPRFIPFHSQHCLFKVPGIEGTIPTSRQGF
ncbi:hypothetical protein B0T20DRAFT_149244 [Sordaria brevicollis]|uniref:Uncharacterized protein n=1 Tax=Sordaria brevicollis TaxID=83679 RepID=A0AAE0UEM2_SORBR|nr:hypothetical protein B0T20DRAFT_149244 [Sordaria brevicollis]